MEARGTLVNRFVKLADRLRQLNTKFGLRPYRVFLVWSKWTGEERGEVNEVEALRIEILPTPKVSSLDSVALNPMSAGIVPVGSLRVTEVSGAFTQDVLMGKKLPVLHEETIPEPWEFFYEVVEDGRGDPEPVRSKFRLMSTPFRNAENVEWNVTLERVSEDRDRKGRSQYGKGTEG